MKFWKIKPVTNNKTVNKFWEDVEYQNYIYKNGEHFTDTLATFASLNLKNRDNTKHSWTVTQVSDAFNKLNYIKPSIYTWGDVTYLANLIYANHYGSSIKTENDCLLHTLDMLSYNTYENKPFSLYLNDVMYLNIKVKWKDM